jgi:phage terminase large subunit-like protein
MKTLGINTPRVFVPALEPARYKILAGGRGSGKSHFLAEMLVERCIMYPGTRAVCVREIQRTLKESAKRLIEDKIKALGVETKFECLTTEIKTPGGGLIIFQGMADHTAESIKSLEGFDVAWVEEAQTLSAKSLEMLRPTIRKPGSELWFSLNPRSPTDPVYDLAFGISPPPDSVIIRANWSDNPFFPAELEQERVFDQRAKPDRYAHVWEGALEPVAIGAIWDRTTLHQHRVRDVPPMDRIVVAIDPAVSSVPGSDEHGIVVVGVGQDGRGYVLDDLSMRGAPHQWASRAIAAMDRWEADGIVIEVNQGGDMCRHTLQSQRPYVRVIEVRATRGKHVRAEPISALYSLGRVSHVGTFDRLEAQMCQMTAAGFEGDGSPDRVDALVWGLTELFPSVTRGTPKPPEPAGEYGGFHGGNGSWMA